MQIRASRAREQTIIIETILVRDLRVHTDVYAAVRDAFDIMRRRLEDYERCRRYQVKAHDGVQQT